MDFSLASNFTFGVASSQYAAPGAIVQIPHEFRILDDDGDDLIRPVAGVAFYNKLSSPTPHGWNVGRLDAIAKATLSSARDVATASKNPPGPQKLSTLVGVGDGLSLYPIAAGTARMDSAAMRDDKKEEPVLVFHNSDDGLDYVIPVDEVLVICTAVADAHAESVS